MCFLCAMRLRKLRLKGYITEDQIREVTSEVEVVFNQAVDMLKDDESRAKIQAVIEEGLDPNIMDTFHIFTGDRAKAGLTDDLIAKMLKEYKSNKPPN